MTPPFYRGLLLTEYFLTEGILDQSAWRGLNYAQIRRFGERAEEILAPTRPMRKIRESAAEKSDDKLFSGGQLPRFNEADTEERIIFPLMKAMGWENAYSRQRGLRRGLPDVVLFHEPRASGWSDDMISNEAVAVQENKRWELPLDAREENKQAPSTQMLRYLTTAAMQSDGRIRWGILTNGRHWRLYSQEARSRSEEFLELDLREILRADPKSRRHWLLVFLLMFRRQAFLPDPKLDGRDFHQYAVNKGRLWEARITRQLSQVLLEEDGALPVLARGLASIAPGDRNDPQFPRRLRDMAAIVLFRLLFALYAEDRGLLPIHKLPVTMREIRDRIEWQMQDLNETPFASTVATLYCRFSALCQLIDRGDPALNLPPYNGGLFKNRGDIAKLKIPDNVFAFVVDSLSRWQIPGEDKKRRVNFRDLSVQHLGDVYEQMLEREFAFDQNGEMQVKLSPYARKTGGSYYTPEPLVRLVIERAVGPLVEEKIRAFEDAAKDPAAPREKLRELDPARAILTLKVCDPAMGSGHFLVSLVDYIADRALEAVVRAEEAAPGHASPLIEDLADMRQSIRKHAGDSKLHLESNQLGDRILMRRLVLKRVVYGADKNPLAAELAKLSLWLHTFTVGAPLSFLDHHLRDGDSLFGRDLASALKFAEDNGGKKLANAVRRAAAESAELMAKVEDRPDADIQQARGSEADFARVAEKSELAGRFLSLLRAENWTSAGEAADKVPPRQRRENHAARQGVLKKLLSGRMGDPASILAEWKAPDAPQECADALRDILARAKSLHSDEKPLHWRAEFPGVWPMTNGVAPTGGFDAVIGNPPWERMKMQEVEWFKLRDPAVAEIKPTNKRREEIARRRKRGDEMISEYDRAARAADIRMRFARECGDFPRLSRGDINLFALFIERGLSLIRPDGMVGLLVPSAVYSDITTAGFFRDMTAQSRVAAVFDFQNGIPKPKNGGNGNNGDNGDNGVSKEFAQVDGENGDNGDNGWAWSGWENGAENGDNGDDEEEEMRGSFFPNVHRQLRFCAFVCGGEKRTFADPQSAFFLSAIRQAEEPERLIPIDPDHFKLVNPNTGTMPIFRCRRDADITLRMFQNKNVAAAHDHSKPPAWPLRYCAQFHLANDTEHFRTPRELKRKGFFRVVGGVYKNNGVRFLPLHVGRMIHHFNHRAASVRRTGRGAMKPYLSEVSSAEQLADAGFMPEPPFWADAARMDFPEGLEWALGFRDITGATNERTAVAALIPRVPCGHTLPLLLPVLPPTPDAGDGRAVKKWESAREKALAAYRANAPLYAANLCSFALDFVCRQKMQGSHLSLYILEQLPVIPAAAYGRKFGGRTAAEIVRSHVLELTYTAEDMRPFARDMGHAGDPFRWDEENRAHLRARLDALYFHLYGIGEADAEYIMSSFPIVERNDRKAHDCYRTRDLILEYMRALSAGNAEDRIAAPTPSRKKAASKRGMVARKRKGKSRRS